MLPHLELKKKYELACMEEHGKDNRSTHIKIDRMRIKYFLYEYLLRQKKIYKTILWSVK